MRRYGVNIDSSISRQNSTALVGSRRVESNILGQVSLGKGLCYHFLSLTKLARGHSQPDKAGFMIDFVISIRRETLFALKIVLWLWS